MLGALGLEAAYGAGFGAGAGSGAGSLQMAPEDIDELTSSASRVVPQPQGTPQPVPGAQTATELANDPHIRAALVARNRMLAPFWLAEQHDARSAGLTGRHAVVIDAEDRFTTMLAHQLRHLGMTVSVVPWAQVAADGEIPLPPDAEYLDLVIAGPGPGDPTDRSDPRMARLRAAVQRRLRDRRRWSRCA